MRFPPPLRAGSRVGLVAPSGSLRDDTDLSRAVENTKAFGWEPVVGDHVLARDGYLAGSDEQRAADLNRFAADDSIDAVWCIRGGYGAARLLDELDYEAWRRRPKTLIGYSDITALHAAIGSLAEVATFHGPTARAELTALSRSSLQAAVTGRGERVIRSGELVTLVPGRVEGRLVGGNLALVASLIGTPYELDLTGAVLVLEDVSEAVYRVDRMLNHLALSGALAQAAGIVFGQFTEIPEDVVNGERPLMRVLEEVAQRWDVPCVANFPVGHVDDQYTLALGAHVELDADTKCLTTGAVG